MLSSYLKRAGHVTGPRAKNTSHSGLEVLKKYLLGIPQFKGGELFLDVGSAVHEVFLEDKYDTYNKLEPHDQERVDGMVARLRKHPVVRSLMKDSIKEEKFIVSIQGVPVAVILDSKQPKLSRAFDLKTTNCTSQKNFIEKAKSLGYPRQGKTYRIAAKVKKFFFVGVQKEKPYDVFIIDIDDFLIENRYAEKELEFLLYFYKNYGKVGTEDANGSGVVEPTNNKSIPTMAKKSGKEVLAAIAEQHKAVKSSGKLLATATKAAEKEKAKLEKLIDSFPANEKELYAEKLAKFQAV